MWSSARTTASPTGEAVTLELAKQYLRVEEDDDSFDSEIGLCVAGTVAEIEKISGTRLVTQVVELFADDAEDLQHLPIGPVQEVLEIAYRDRAGAWQVIPAEQYQLIGAGLECGIEAAPGFSLRTVAPVETGRQGLKATLQVGYGAGPDDVPPNLLVAILRGVRGLFDDKPVELSPLIGNDRIWM